ncbi:putative protein 430R [Cricket iridovirus]|uniref:430R n=2 Tax=Iridovirus TaxID=10487 RepID=Q91F95_IIV6|nr:430R [Invertebrate iridescent virus 6]AAK82290.1 430R [Invertebrate iridescent virus 6]QMS79433.1 hypothetical protein IIV6-T1_422 [Invertebrate iridescent virus 6]QNH08840.1 430R [Invertebrate iridescent virus Kaz2018]UIB20675.1 putative protein 430R [Cricket iridovirus]
MIISGIEPSSIKGMSTSSKIIPTVPFCAIALQNLSPISGLFCCAMTILNIKIPFFDVLMILSTFPSSEIETIVE